VAGESVHVEGLRDLRRQLQALDRELDSQYRGELRAELKQVAETAAGWVRAALPFDTSRKKRQTGVVEHWREAIKAGTSVDGAYVEWGRARVPYAGWLEFGGTRQGRPGSKPAQRDRVQGGRYVYPTVHSARPTLEREVSAALERMIRRAGLE
jgi:hypothetical protein